jgi:hypothetical protein
MIDLSDSPAQKAAVVRVFVRAASPDPPKYTRAGLIHSQCKSPRTRHLVPDHSRSWKEDRTASRGIEQLQSRHSGAHFSADRRRCALSNGWCTLRWRMPRSTLRRFRLLRGRIWMDEDTRLDIIARHLSPTRPIRSSEYLRGRTSDLDRVARELRHFHGVPFLYGYRGVGKTSLARTAAQLTTASDRDHIYVACAPGSRMLHIFRDIGEALLKAIFR